MVITVPMADGCGWDYGSGGCSCSGCLVICPSQVESTCRHVLRCPAEVKNSYRLQAPLSETTSFLQKPMRWRSVDLKY